MKGIFGLLLMTIAGWIGWWLGEFVGITTAVVLSMVASGFGLYLARRIDREYFG